jgi:hypothetical protein
MLRIFILAVAACCGVAAAAPFQPPEVRFGATTAQVQASLAGKCTQMTTRGIDPPFLPRIKDKQVQVDCEGYLFQGKPRHAEFVIGDDRLEMVWIMHTAPEDDAIRTAMVADYGAPDHHNKVYDAFAGHRAALRLDKHEVLFYAADLDADMAPDFAPDAH